MRRIGMGLVGPGFVGTHHIDAVRRLGFVDVIAVAASSDRSARAKADALGVPKAYGSYEALAADPDVHVVHNTTPNNLHVPVIMAALTHRKHVVSDKPLALNTEDARALVNAAREAGVVHAVTFNYRGNPLVQQAREMIRDGEIGAAAFRPRRLLAGLAASSHRLLLAARAGEGGKELGDWRYRIALVRSGPARRRPADRSGARGFEHGRGHAFQAAEEQRSVRSRRRTGRRVPRAERGSCDRAGAVRGWRAGLGVRRTGVRGSQERPVVRGERRERIAALAPGTTERAVDRPSRCRERRAGERSLAAPRGARVGTRICRAGIRRPGPMPSATL